MYEGFLPTTKKEMDELGIEQFDFIYITGDAYVDHPSFGAAIVTRLIESLGFTAFYFDALEAVDKLEGKELLALLQDDEMVLLTTPLNIMQERKLNKLQRQSGWPDDPSLMRKYKKLDRKRVYVYYYLSESIAKPADADAAEGTPQP